MRNGCSDNLLFQEDETSQNLFDLSKHRILSSVVGAKWECLFTHEGGSGNCGSVTTVGLILAARVLLTVSTSLSRRSVLWLFRISVSCFAFFSASVFRKTTMCPRCSQRRNRDRKEASPIYHNWQLARKAPTTSLEFSKTNDVSTQVSFPNRYLLHEFVSACSDPQLCGHTSGSPSCRKPTGAT